MSTLLNHFDIVRVTMVTQLAPQVALTRFHYLVGNIVGAPTDLDFANDFDTGINAFWKANISAAATYRGVMAQIMRPVPPVSPTFYQLFQRAAITANSGVGTRGATPMPGQVRGLLTYKGTLAVRGLNPRSYIPFPSTTDAGVDAYTPAAAYKIASLVTGTQVLTFNTVTDGGGNNTTVNLVDWSPLATKHLDPGVRESLTTVAFNNKWATQRRSGAYGRPNTPPI